MKKRLLLLLSLILFMSTTMTNAQRKAPQQFPIDPKVRTGTLPNGMQYYIYKNSKPKGLVDFYIIHNVGAIQEDDNENGLAHFLEHMAFNGTKNLPDKMLLDYFQANGVEFGRDINAMTGMDLTQYMIKNVPIVREGIIDTAIIALADWSSGIALKGKEIDNERGVILEEKRTINSPDRRMQQQFLPVIFNGTKYAKRNVIGTEKILKNFKHSEIRDFYAKWYRPDLQAVVVVGDVDVYVVEAKIKEIIGAIPKPVNPKRKEEHIIPPFEKDIAKVITDKEATGNAAMVVSMHEKEHPSKRTTKMYAVKSLVESIVTGIMSERFYDISKQLDAPFLGAQIGHSDITPNNRIFSINVSAKEGQIPTAIEAAVKEVTRLRKYGVTQDEVFRMINNIKENNQTIYDNRADRKTEAIAEAIIDSYVNNSPVITPKVSYKFYKETLEQLTAPIINKLIPVLFQDKPSAIISMTPERIIAMPTEKILIAALNSGRNATVKPPVEVIIDRPLLENIPIAVSISDESKDVFGHTVWTLKNGATVIVKPTNFRADEIMFSATGDGGNNMVSDDKILSSTMLSNVLAASGLGTFTTIELSKVLSGKSASVGKSVGGYSHSISGGSTIKDIETMFKLLHLSYTNQPFPQKDFDLVMSRVRANLDNVESQPSYIFQNKCKKVLYGDNKRVEQVNSSNINKVKLEHIKEIHDMLYDGVRNMTFIFTGSIDEKVLKPLVEKYIGSLPRGLKKNKNATSTKLVKGKVSKTFPIKQATPKVVYSAMFYSDNIKDMSLKSLISATILSDILTVKYLKTIREEQGATYGVGANISTQQVPFKRYIISVGFDTNKEKLAMAAAQVKKEIELIANGATIKEELNIARGAKLKNFDMTINSSNAAWISYISSYNDYGINYPKDYKNELNNITESDIQKLAKKILESGNEIELIMTPSK